MERLTGKKIWMLPDMYWPTQDHGTYVSHEAVCVLNVSDQDANVRMTLYYENQDPVCMPIGVAKAKRTSHIRMDQLTDTEGKKLLRGVGYAAVIESDVPIVVQYTRVDTTQPELALMSTMAYDV